MLRLFRYVGLGALIAYFFDPDNGHRRRALARERIPALLRRGSQQIEQAGGAVSSEPTAATKKVKQPADVTLARKVETEILRGDAVPKGQISVNAEKGVVVLRGEVEKPALIKDLEKRTRSVQGVKEVENLLHVPGKPAPTK